MLSLARKGMWMEYWVVKSLWAPITFRGNKRLDNAWQLLVACHFGGACNCQQIRAWTRRTMTSPLVWRRNRENCLLSSLLTIVDVEWSIKTCAHFRTCTQIRVQIFQVCLIDVRAGACKISTMISMLMASGRVSKGMFFRSGHRCLGTGNHDWMRSGVFCSKFFGTIARPPFGRYRSGSKNEAAAATLMILIDCE